MNKQNTHIKEEEWNKRWEQRAKKKKINMKVSGSGVKKLQKIIINKS